VKTYRCFDCKSTFTEADKDWDIAVNTGRCPRCHRILRDFPQKTALGGSSYQNTSQGTHMELLLKYFFKINPMNFAIKVAIFVIVLGAFRLSRLSQVMPQEAWPKAIVALAIVAASLASLAYAVQWLFGKWRSYLDAISQKSDKKFGVQLIDLNNKFRKIHQSNTGALVKKVFEDSPAFYSNVLPGDVIVEIEGKRIIDAGHALRFLEDARKWPGQMTLIRNGRQVNIEMDYEQLI
jgi:DNA-directed RNA polymerase subunit RPC12/RpoP